MLTQDSRPGLNNFALAGCGIVPKSAEMNSSLRRRPSRSAAERPETFSKPFMTLWARHGWCAAPFGFAQGRLYGAQPALHLPRTSVFRPGLNNFALAGCGVVPKSARKNSSLPPKTPPRSSASSAVNVSWAFSVPPCLRGGFFSGREKTGCRQLQRNRLVRTPCIGMVVEKSIAIPRLVLRRVAPAAFARDDRPEILSA